jgi:N-hydroxyarylamine O-acetyltransferase
MSNSTEHAQESVLVVGQDPDVLGFVIDEVAETGTQVRGTTLADVQSADDAAFDLVAFGAGVPWDERKRLEARFRAGNPNVRFLRTYAPYAASQITAAIKGPPAPAPVDLQAYFDRIGYRGTIAATLETLRALQERHVATITFEAIDVLLDRRIDLTPQAVDAKLIARARGGYCYEQNGLFKRVLSAMGFEVDALVTSVRWMAEPGAPPPARAHMALRVTIDGVPWLVDVGFGSSVPPAPLRIDTREEQPTPHGRYRIIPLGAGSLVQTELAGKWQALYDFSPEPMLDSQFELFNWFASTHPTSHFRHNLIVARTTPEARYALLDNRLTVRLPSGRTERSQLDRKGVAEALEKTFGLTPEADWEKLLEAAGADQAVADPAC